MTANPFDIASKMAGASEIANHAAIQDYLKTGGANLDPATAAWCAAFVNSTLTQAGYKGTGSNLARSFLNYGEPVTAPVHGDLAVFSRGAPGSGLGHVGFVDRLNPDGTVRVLSGNHGNAVAFSNYPTTNLLGYRRPVGGNFGDNPGADPGHPTQTAMNTFGDVVSPNWQPGTMDPNKAAAAMSQVNNAPQQTAVTVPDPASSFGDIVAPQPPQDLGSIAASYLAKKQNNDAVEQERRRALLLGSVVN